MPETETERVGLSEGAHLIATERRRQIDAEGYTPEHDREHGGFALSQAAYCYKAHGLLPPGAVPDQWPWDRESWKPRDPISNLIRAGALYLAAADLGYFGARESAQRCADLIDASADRIADALPALHAELAASREALARVSNLADEFARRQSRNAAHNGNVSCSVWGIAGAEVARVIRAERAGA